MVSRDWSAWHALHTKSIVLFGPTPLSYFALDKNINLAPAKCGDC